MTGDNIFNGRPPERTGLARFSYVVGYIVIAALLVAFAVVVVLLLAVAISRLWGALT